MSQLEVNKVIPQSGTTLTVGEAGDTVDISNATLTANINASSLTSGTIPDARFPATLPAVDGSLLTNVQVTGGYVIIDPITVTNTDTFALTSSGSPVSPASASNCIVSVNGVVQAPLTSYTISGSNIVFASALSAGSDVIDFITVLGSALNVGTVSDGTIGLAKLSATGTPSASTFLRGDNTWQSAGGANTPAFLASATGSAQAFSNATDTLIQYNNSVFDTDSGYNTGSYSYTVPSGQGGKYRIGAQIFMQSAGNAGYTYIAVKVNGTTKLALQSGQTPTVTNQHYQAHGILVLSAGDVLTCYEYQNSGATRNQIAGADDNFFYGFKLIGV